MTENIIQSRRLRTIRNNIDLFLFLTFLSTIFHLFHAEYSSSPLFLNTVALSYLFVFYAGYKFGRWWGLLCGALSAGFWFLFIEIYGERSLVQSLLELSYSGAELAAYPPLADFVILYGSLQYVLVFGAVGFFAGYIIDKLEEFLWAHQLSVEDFLPRPDLLFVRGVGGWIANLLKAMFLVTEDGDKGAAVVRFLRTFFVVVIGLLMLFVFNALSGNVFVEAGPLFQVNLIPVGVASVLALWIAYLFGPKAGVLVALSLLFSPLLGELANQQFGESGLTFHYGLVSPGAVVALTVMAWIVGLSRKQYLTDTIHQKITLQLGDPHPKYSRMRLWHVVALVVFSAGMTIKFESSQLQWSPLGLLSIYIVWLTLKYNYKQISNIVLVTSGVLLLLEIKIPLDQSGSLLRFGGLHAYQAMFLVLLPLAVPMFKPTSLAKVRAFLFSVLFGSWIIYLVFAPGAYGLIPDVSVLWKVERAGVTLLSILAAAVLYELGARIVWMTHRPKS